MSAQGAGPRRSEARTAVVQQFLAAALADLREAQVLDIGGGTGGFAVRVAELGHYVTVVDPSPDALAILDRRAEETGVSARVQGIQGELATVPDLLAPNSMDVVLCHGVLEVVEDPSEALSSIVQVLRRGGLLSLLVSQRHAAVVAKAVAGQFVLAQQLLEGSANSPHRFTASQILSLLEEAGFASPVLHAIRVFSDLVPSGLVDGEPGAAAALAELERAVAERPEYLPLANQVHALATRL